MKWICTSVDTFCSNVYTKQVQNRYETQKLIRIFLICKLSMKQARMRASFLLLLLFFISGKGGYTKKYISIRKKQGPDTF